MRRGPAFGMAVIAYLAASLPGCVPSGDDPRSQLTEARAASGAYVVRYLEPPWQLDAIVGDTMILHVASTGETFAGIEGGPGKYDLVTSIEAGTPDVLIERERGQARTRGDTILADPRPLTNRDGVVGAELLTRNLSERPRNQRIALFPLDPSRSLRLAFDATPELDTLEVDAMLREVSIGTTP